MGINQFSDMSTEEFSQLYGKGGLKRSNEGKKKSLLKQKLMDNDEQQVELPEFVDWHKEGKMTEPQDQGGCGSCWAFTTAATMESGFAIKRNSTPERLSVQYLIDCDTVNFGCGGGWMLDAYEFTKKNGIVKESDYNKKYLARKEACKDPSEVKNEDRIHNSGDGEEDSITVQRLKELVSKSPVGLAMHSNPKCLMGYHSGVVREEDCHCSDEKTATVNHAVTLVGYGKNTQNN